MTPPLHANTDETSLRIADFAPEPAFPPLRWQVVNDTVMGGRSRSRHAIRDHGLHFSGTLNTNGGGFASLRSNRVNHSLAEFDHVRLRVKGDGRAYRFRLFLERDRASYQNEFTTRPDTWMVVELPIADFYASWRGRRLNRAAPAPGDIRGVGFILADGIDGDFHLVVDWIEFTRRVSNVTQASAKRMRLPAAGDHDA
ncbi:MAG: CIA30 family protein [Pseudomonadota bacterium]